MTNAQPRSYAPRRISVGLDDVRALDVIAKSGMFRGQLGDIAQLIEFWNLPPQLDQVFHMVSLPLAANFAAIVPQLLVPKNQRRRSLLIGYVLQLGFAPSYSYGFPVKARDFNSGTASVQTDFMGIPLSQTTGGPGYAFQGSNGVVAIDDIWVFYGSDATNGAGAFPIGPAGAFAFEGLLSPAGNKRSRP